MVHELLSGTYDLHIHTAPDVIPRKCTDEETVRRLEAAGMRDAPLSAIILRRRPERLCYRSVFRR